MGNKSGVSFALGAAIVMRAHNAKTKVAEENEELLLEEMAIQNKKHDSR